MLRASVLLTAACCGLLAMLGLPAGVNAQIRSITAGTGAEKGLVIAELDTGATGTLCYLNDVNVPKATCAALLGMSKGFAAKERIFTGTTCRTVVAALNGCPTYRPSSGVQPLSDACEVRTGPGIPAPCHSRLVSLDCHPLIAALRYGRDATEGLVVTSLSGVNGTICAQNVGSLEAAAVCRYLGFPDPERGFPIVGRYYANSSNSDEDATIESLKCLRNESLPDCTWQVAVNSSCKSTNRLAVSCPPAIVTPKPLPSPALQCFRSQASVCFKKAAISSADDLQLEVRNGTNCSYSTVGTADSLCLMIRTYDQCALEFANKTGYTEYKLVVQFKGETDLSGNYIRQPLEFILLCAVNGESLATGPPIAPEFVTPTSASGGRLRGDLVMRLYRELRDGELKDPVVGGVKVGTLLFAAAILTGASSESRLVVRDCWVAGTSKRVDLVKGGCPTKADFQLIPVNETVMAVRFQAFILANDSSSTMSISCSTIICHKDDPATECSRNRVCPPAFRGPFALARTDDVIAAKSASSRLKPEYWQTPPALLTVYDENSDKSGVELGAARSFWYLLSILLSAKARVL